MWSSRYSKEKENVYDHMISLRSWHCTVLKSTGSCSIEFKDIEIIWNTNDMNVCVWGEGVKIECRDKYQKAVVSGHSNIETWTLLWNLYWFQISCIRLSLLFRANATWWRLALLRYWAEMKSDSEMIGSILWELSVLFVRMLVSSLWNCIKLISIEGHNHFLGSQTCW